jgi:hypothetical protein
MNLKQFLAECNKTPLLKKYQPITNSILKEVNFIKKEYVLDDLCELENRLFFITPTMIENKEPAYLRHKRTHKDLSHADLIKLHDNKVFIKKLRQELDMPYDNKGFIVLKRNSIPYLRSYTGFNFENIHPDYKKWYFHWNKNEKYLDELNRLFDAGSIVRHKIFEVVKKALEKWKLPWRYYDAIEELILFNTIIPADPGITWSAETKRNGRPRMCLSFDIDTTKEELIKVIKEDECNMLKNRYKYLSGKIRRKRKKSKENEEMIEIYNRYKKEGKKDQDIFIRLQIFPEYEDLSISAIRDRIKGN